MINQKSMFVGEGISCLCVQMPGTSNCHEPWQVGGQHNVTSLIPPVIQPHQVNEAKGLNRAGPVEDLP